jgi:ligand-binding sensor domain-containing protein
LNSYDGEKFTRYKHNPLDPESIADDKVWEIYEDSQHNLWVGTLGSGLDLFDRDKNIFYHYRAEGDKSVHSNYIFSIIESKEGDLYVGTAFGLDIKEKGTENFATHQGNRLDGRSDIRQ